MDKELQSRITSFFDCWRQRYTFISDLDLKTNRYEANILLWGNLDALSNLWAKSIGKRECTNNSGKRIIFDAFLAHYGSAEFKLVSLPDVWYRVDRGDTMIDHKKGIKLHKDVSNFLSKIGGRRTPNFLEERSTRSVSNDLSIDDIVHQTLANSHKNTHIELEKWLIFSRYGAIVYKEFRNSYIHEGQPGKKTHDFELYQWAEKPTYLSRIYGTPPIMGFSVEFILTVFKKCIDNFETEALKRQIDPFAD